MLPAVRHLTVTLSSRELRRFRLVLLLISNECSSLVAATPYRDESMLMRERFYHLLYLFPSIVVSFLPLFLFLSLSVTLIARRASLTFLLSTIETVGARQLVRSLARSAVHSPTPLSFVSLSLLTRHPPIAKSNIRRCTAASTDDLVFPLHKTHEAVPHIPNECTDGGYRSGSENHKCSLGSACMRLLSSYKMYTIHSHTRTHTCPRARTQARTCTHTYIHTYTYGHTSKLCHSVRITYTLVQKRIIE